MFRRKPTKIKLDLADLTDFVEEMKHAGEGEKKNENRKDSASEVSRDMPIVNRASNVEARRAEVQRRIGYAPDPTPITTQSNTQFENIH